MSHSYKGKECNSNSGLLWQMSVSATVPGNPLGEAAGKNPRCVLLPPAQHPGHHSLCAQGCAHEHLRRHRNALSAHVWHSLPLQTFNIQLWLSVYTGRSAVSTGTQHQSTGATGPAFLMQQRTMPPCNFCSLQSQMKSTPSSKSKSNNKQNPPGSLLCMTAFGHHDLISPSKLFQKTSTVVPKWFSSQLESSHQLD